MLFSLIILLCLVLSFYYKKITFLFILSLILLFYNLFLYQCFYDNITISNWLQAQEITNKENIDYQITEYNQSQIISFTLALSLLFAMICYFGYKIIKQK